MRKPSGLRPRQRGGRWQALEIASLALGVLLLLNLLRSALLALSGAGEDYLAFASAGRLVSAGSHCLYCVADLGSQQAGLLGYVPPPGAHFPLAFLNPPLFAFVMQPIARLPLDAGLRVWVSLLVVATAVSLVAIVGLLATSGWRHVHLPLALAVVASAPATSGMLLAQVDPLLLVPGLASIGLVRARHTFAAGLVLSLLLVKPQLVWLVGPLLLACGMWRMLTGFFVGAAVWLASAPLLVGVDHLGGLITVLGSLDQQRQLGEARSLPGLLGVAQVNGATVLVCALGLGTMVAIAAWRRRDIWRTNPEMVVGVGILSSLVCAPHLFSHDYVLLAVPLMVWARHQPWPALVAGLALSGAYVIDVHLPVRFAHVQAITVALIGVMIWADITGRPVTTARRLRQWRSARAAMPPSLQLRQG